MHSLTFSCPHSDPLFLTKVQLLLHFTLSHLKTWYSGQMGLFLFILARAALAYLPTALSVALRPLFPYQQVQYAQVFPLKPVPLSKLFAGLGSTNKSVTSLLFPSYLTLVLSLLTMSLPLSPPVLLGYNGSKETRFFWEMAQLMS